MKNKHIERDEKIGTEIFDKRSLAVDYRTLVPVLKQGMSVLDVGCGTGAITNDIATLVGEGGKVIGIDNTDKFISSGINAFKKVGNLQLINSDLFEFETDEKFDLVIAARTLQWLNNPKAALIKMKSFLKPRGVISVLDYNHNKLVWNPDPPLSMQKFYKSFLKWRREAGMNNAIADDLPRLMQEIGMANIQSFDSNEHYERNSPDFKSKVGIWSKVAGLKQIVEEGYIDEDLRLKAIEEYDAWVENDAISMTMYLKEVRGVNAES